MRTKDDVMEKQAALIEFYQSMALILLLGPYALAIAATPFVIAWSYLKPRRPS